MAASIFEGWDAAEGVPSALAAARDAADLLLRDRGLRRTGPELTAQSLLRGAAASATLEGWPTEVAALAEGDATPGALAAARVNAELLALVPVVTRAPLQAVARLHTLAAAGHTPPDELGRPRDAAAADALRRWAAGLGDASAAPGMAVAALSHAELTRVAPFPSRNGLVARAVERMLLVARGVDPTSLLVPEAAHLAAGDDYRAALEAYAAAPAGRGVWLAYAARAFTDAVAHSPAAPGGAASGTGARQRS